MSSHLPKIIRVTETEDNTSNNYTRPEILPPTKPKDPLIYPITDKGLGKEATAKIISVIAFEEAAPSEIIADAAKPIVEVAAASASLGSRLKRVTQGYLETSEDEREQLPPNHVDVQICPDTNLDTSLQTEGTFFGELISEIKDDYSYSRSEADNAISKTILKVLIDQIIDFVTQAPMLLGTAVRLTNSLLKKIKINPFKKVIKSTFSQKYKNIQSLKLSSKNRIAFKEVRFIKEILDIIKDTNEEFAEFAQMNPNIHSHQFENSDNFSDKTLALIGKLISISIREGYDDAIFRKKLINIFKTLMKILDNSKKIKYLENEETFLVVLESINLQLDEILDSRIQLKLLDNKTLRAKEVSEIITIMHDVLQTYIRYNDNESNYWEIYNHSTDELYAEIDELTSIEFSVDPNCKFKNFKTEQANAIARLYEYSLYNELANNKIVQLKIARAIKNLILCEHGRSFAQYIEKVILPLEEEILNITESE